MRLYDRLPEDVVKDAQQKFEEAGAVVQTKTGNRFSLRLDAQTLDRVTPVLVELVKRGVGLESE